ncbi:MAG TPA: LysM peptidoglycan-binding domain-containing protein [Acholeplasmataceae bacterium]|jgi:N-acetylmuramoyl-L-alanine amidase|nr:LysM peptidoglycan-binding domain-containing protein [Acholeplasmataceae bacterium]
MLVILDPGHGGWDPGGGTNELWKEKDLTLKISQYQNRRFQDLGIPSKLSRTGDETLTPQERVARINSMLEEGTILISNHINNSGSKGAEVIYSIRNSPMLAQMIAEEIRKTGQNIRNVYTRTNAQGQDYYFILRGTFPDEAVLVEYGFADNIDDKQRLYYNWQALAEAVVRAVANYLEMPYQLPYYTIHVVRPGESLFTIARDYNITVDKLIRDNGLTSDQLAVGQELFIYI